MCGVGASVTVLRLMVKEGSEDGGLSRCTRHGAAACADWLSRCDVAGAATSILWMCRIFVKSDLNKCYASKMSFLC